MILSQIILHIENIDQNLHSHYTKDVTSAR